MIRLGLAGKMGRGVFATQKIPHKTIIMVAHTICLLKSDIKELTNTTISGHYFKHPREDYEGLFVLGLITMLNHSYDPNVEIVLRKKKTQYIAECIAIKPINARSQLFMDYGEDVSF